MLIRLNNKPVLIYFFDVLPVYVCDIFKEYVAEMYHIIINKKKIRRALRRKCNNFFINQKILVCIITKWKKIVP